MKLHLICSNDALRPTMHFVKITKEYMFATDGCVAGVIPTCNLFDQDFINGIPEQGILVHKDDFAKLIKGAFFVWRIPGEVISVLNQKTRNFLIEVETESKEGKFPDILSVIPKNKDGNVSKIGINFKLAYNLQQALGFENCKLEFSSESTAVFVTDGRNVDSGFGLLIPVTLKN